MVVFFLLLLLLPLLAEHLTDVSVIILHLNNLVDIVTSSLLILLFFAVHLALFGILPILLSFFHSQPAIVQLW